MNKAPKWLIFLIVLVIIAGFAVMLNGERKARQARRAANITGTLR